LLLGRIICFQPFHKPFQPVNLISHGRNIAFGKDHMGLALWGISPPPPL